MYVQINKATREGKKYTAIFYDNEKSKIRTVHFGADNSSTYLNHKNDDIKQAWIARHKVREILIIICLHHHYLIIYFGTSQVYQQVIMRI
jgi:hypothetical protein